MNSFENQVRQFVKQVLTETKLRRTREGNAVEFASEEYISEVEQDLDQLVSMRDRRGMRTRERYVLSQAVRHLRNSLGRAKRTRDRLEKVKSAKNPVIFSEKSAK